KGKLLTKAKAEAIAGRGNSQVKTLMDEINKLMDMEECMWNQRSKIDWLKDGDQNTKYFHCRATERNKRNFIAGLEDNNGNWIEDENKIVDMIVRFYSSLFSLSNPMVFDEVLGGVEPRVTQEINVELLRPFEASKVQLALKQMEVNTAPGPDGLPPLF
ncbi:hypothetical protein ACB092_05G094100, partial [Castanea dentata]